MTSYIFKVFGITLKDVVVDHLVRLILGSQHGFRKGMSCLSNLLTFLETAPRLLEQLVTSYLWTLQRPLFDEVLHWRLMLKLKLQYKGNVEKWTEGWLN